MRAFGFEKQAVYLGSNNVVMHAQLTFGNGMVMIGSVDSGMSSSPLMKQPDEMGGAETQAPCLIVSDCEGIFESAKAAGAEMIVDLKTQEYGGQAFTCKDPEGHVWHVGSYDPWIAKPA